MLTFIKLMKGWADRLTIRVLGVFSSLPKESIDKVKTALNNRNNTIENSVDGLKSEDPTNVDTYIKILYKSKFIRTMGLILIIFLIIFGLTKIKKLIKR